MPPKLRPQPARRGNGAFEVTGPVSPERKGVVGFGWIGWGEVGEVERVEVLADRSLPRDRSGLRFGLARLGGGRVPVPLGGRADDAGAAVGLLVVVDRAEPFAVRAGGGAAEVEVVAVVDLEVALAVAAGDDASSISRPESVLDGPSSVAGGGGVGSDVDQVVQEHVDERFGE